MIDRGDVQPVQLGSRVIEPHSRPYLIAEIGVNHEGSIERAMDLIRLAKEGGADAAKFQSYKAEKLAALTSPAYWDLREEPTPSQFEMFKKYDVFDKGDYEHLAAYSREIGIDFLSTPFDLEAVRFLEPICPFFKVASADITNVPLLRAVGECHKPVVMSTGASNRDEIEGAIRILEEAGAADVIVMHCILKYPCDYQSANLAMVSDLSRLFPGRLIGYSDHTRPTPDMLPLIAAWLAGAAVLEKHFTYDKTLSGNDHYHAMDVSDCRRFREQCEFVQLLLGQSKKEALADEATARQYARRTLFTVRQINAGEVVAGCDLIALRGATGIPVSEWDDVLGRTAVRTVGKASPLLREDLS
jgi:N-acetylneuraminate synthase